MGDLLGRSFADPTIAWVMITAMATAALAVLTWFLLIVARTQLTELAATSKKQERTTNADFIYRMRRDFFTAEARQLIFLIEQDLIKLHRETIWFFSIERGSPGNVDDRLTELGIDYRTFSTYTLDDIILGPLEDVGVFWKSGLITIDDAYEEFDFYFQVCVESDVVMEYIRACREQPDNSDIYQNLLDLSRELKVYGKKVRNRENEITNQ